MPANRGNTPSNWSPQPDFAKDLGLHHALPDVTTESQLADWLDDANILADAEVYRHVKPELAREMIEDYAAAIALQILEDTRGNYYEVDEAYDRYLAKQRGERSYGIVELPNKDRLELVGILAVSSATH